MSLTACLVTFAVRNTAESQLGTLQIHSILRYNQHASFPLADSQSLSVTNVLILYMALKKKLYNFNNLKFNVLSMRPIKLFNKGRKLNDNGKECNRIWSST
jgi:hypothetical protein